MSKTCTDSTFADDRSFFQIYSHIGSRALAVKFCQQKRKYPLSADYDYHDGDDDDYHDGDDEDYHDGDNVDYHDGDDDDNHDGDDKDEGVMHSLLRVSRLKEDK